LLQNLTYEAMLADRQKIVWNRGRNCGRERVAASNVQIKKPGRSPVFHSTRLA
jgi:hypothetical protein